MLCSYICYGQKGKALGLTVDSITNHSIAYAAVVVYKGENIIGTTQSDSLGNFKISAPLFVSCTHLEINARNYNRLIYIKKKNVQQDIDTFIGRFKLVPEGINLREVVIKKRRKYRDTLNIDLSKEHFERNVMIDHLFSGSKGFHRDTQGKLYFKGKEVMDVVVNNGDFFGKNNLDIYKYLPALTLNNMEIIETDIDSITNTIMSVPKIRVNMHFKEKFKRGKFGGLFLGYGTIDRYVLATDLYSYNGDRQTSLVLNSNNINADDNPYTEPNVAFSPNGNNSLAKSAKLSYRNLFFKKRMEVEASIKGKTENRKFISESLRQDESTNQLSTTSNTSLSKAFGLESTSLSINYRVDSLNTIRMIQSFDYGNHQQMDAMSYLITAPDFTTNSKIDRDRRAIVSDLSSNLIYQKRFASERGRMLELSLNTQYKKYNNREKNDIFSDDPGNPEQYFINGDRTAQQRTLELAATWTKPWGDNGFLTLVFKGLNENIRYEDQVLSDAILDHRNEFKGLSNFQLSSGLKLQKIFNERFTLRGTLMGIMNFRTVEERSIKPKDDWKAFNAEANFDFTYTLNKQKKMTLNYVRKMNFPGVTQLTSINNSFDLISQSQGNPYLKPELNDRFQLLYEFRKQDSLSIFLTGSVDLYSSKFGLNVANEPGRTQQTFLDNIGNSNASEISFLILKKMRNGKRLNYRLGLGYQESPIIVNHAKYSNKGYVLNQSISSSFVLLKSLSINPVFSAAYSGYDFQNSSSKVLSLTFSDKISWSSPKAVTINAYPLVNYSKGINEMFTWAINAEVRRNILKGYGTVWLKAYDIFNSFRFSNNFIGANYTQSIRYTNLNRYFLLGLSLKFNNMR